MSEFKFDTWCAKYELKDSTRKWLVSNGCDSLSALRGMNADEIPIGAEGVENLGERSKLRGGVQDLKAPVQGRRLLLKNVERNFRELLAASGLVHIDAAVLDRALNQPRVMTCSTPEAARKLYDAIDQLPQTYTVNHLATHQDVQVRGMVESLTPFARSLVYFAFDQGCISALKIPIDEGEAKHEVEVWEALQPVPSNIRLVGPLRMLDIERRVPELSKPPSDSKFKRLAISSLLGRETNLPQRGILMPVYACSLDKFRHIATHREITRWCASVFDALKYMHSKGWSHNDVKSSNIFLDFEGNAYLADYGACKKFGDELIQYTDAYWPTDLVRRAAAINDYYLLLITALDLAGAWRSRSYFEVAAISAEVRDFCKDQETTAQGFRQFLLGVLLEAQNKDTSSTSSPM